MSKNNLDFWEIHEELERQRLEEKHRRLESLSKARKRLPYKTAAIISAIFYIYIVKEITSDNFNILLLLFIGLWYLTSRNAWNKPNDPFAIERIVDLLLFIVQFVILCIVFIVAWRHYSNFWFAVRDIIIILTTANLGSPILSFLIFTGLWKVIYVFDSLGELFD